MKILCVVDKIDSAIYRCAKAGYRMSDWFDYEIVAVHPKRPSAEQLEEFRSKAWEADIIDFQYWKNANLLIESFPFLKDKKKILTHHNPYDCEVENWFDKFDEVVVKNQTQQKTIALKFGKSPICIPHTIDLDTYRFQREYPRDDIFKVIMVVARIESNKGVLEVAKACKATKSRLILVGRVSDVEYIKSVMAEGGDYIDFRQNITDEELVKSYYESHLHICNSKDNFESGTMPILESMACGVPVLTRMVGLVPDIYNKKNMVVRNGVKEDWEEIALEIERLKKDRDLRMLIREEAFNTIIGRDDEYTAKRYYRLYRKVMYGEKPLVSVVIPTYNRKGILSLGLASIYKQNYENVEIVVVDDGGNDGTDELVNEFRKETGMPIKYVWNENNGYGLARSRNLGVLEANGEVIILMDDRLMMEDDAIVRFLDKLEPKVWVFGDKGANKTSFVENFSCVYKKDLITLGMFNERMIYWGGMTRDLTLKMRYTGFTSLYCPMAKAKVLLGSKSRHSKKDELVKAKLLLWKLWGEK